MAGPDMGALSKKVGPLPAGVWVLIVGGGLGVSYYINRNQTGAAAAPVAPSTAVSSAGTGYQTAGSGGSSGGYVTNPATGSSAVNTAPQTNEAWVAAATQALKARGTYDSYSINVALRKYLGGQKLTGTEQTIIAQALDAVGPTPGVLGIDADYLKPVTQGFYSMIGDAFNRIYEVFSDGSYQWVSPDAYAKSGSPTVVKVSSDSPVFSGTQVGANPFPGNKPPAAKVSIGFYRYGGTLAVYEFFSDGTKQFIDFPTWVAKGYPNADHIDATDPIWQRPSVGFDPMAAPASQAPGPLALTTGQVIPVGSNLTNVPSVASPNQ